MNDPIRRIAISLGGGYVPGLAGVVRAIARSAQQKGWALVGLHERGIDALVGIVGGSAVTGSHALSVMWKLARKGLSCVCIPKSVENDLAATPQPFGYDNILAYTTDTLRHIRIAARDQGRVALVELPGKYAGPVTAADRVLGVGYGACATDALDGRHTAHLLAARPEGIVSVPLSEAVNRIRTIEATARALCVARAQGVCLGAPA